MHARTHARTYLLGGMLNKVGQEIGQHVRHKGRSDGGHGKGGFRSTFIDIFWGGRRRCRLEALEGALEERGSGKGAVEHCCWMFRINNNISE